MTFSSPPPQDRDGTGPSAPGPSAPRPGAPATERTRRLRSGALRTASAGIFALAGLLFWVSFNTAQGTDLRSDDPMLRLPDLIQERARTNRTLESTTAELREQVDALAEADHARSPAEQRALRRLEDAAGAEEVSGEGLTVTLTDAPPDATAQLPGWPEPEPDYLVIHQQDLQAVVNALWAGGAQGIKVMDQRLISTSAVRCVGNTLILQGQLYSPPYTVTAVGDPDRLRSALDDAPALRTYRQYVEAYGLGWDVERHRRTTLPGYNGPVDLQYAEPVD